MAIEIGDTKLTTWFERDRAHVCLSDLDNKTIIEWWDGAVEEAIQDGFLKPDDYHRTAFRYAREHGFLEPGAKPASIHPIPQAWAAAAPGLGIYCGWKTGGAPIWSSEVDEAGAATGAYTFTSEEEARRLFDDDGTENGVFELVDLDITEPNRRDPSRASFDSCQVAGLDPERAARTAPATTP
jgi:hypothetical protein